MDLRVRARSILVATAACVMGCAAEGGPSASSHEGAEGASAAAQLAPELDAQEPAPADERVAPPQWQADVFRRIAAGEYAVRSVGAGLEAVNRNQDLRTRWLASGVELRAREAATLVRVPEETPAVEEPEHDGPMADAPSLRVRTIAVARAGTRRAARELPFVLGECRRDGAVDELGECLERTELRQAEWVEWWENREAGLEQGFDFEHRPLAEAGDAPLQIEIELEVERIELDADGLGATLELGAGEALRYEKLAAFDADGRELTTRMLAREGGITIEVDERDAVYPIWVDPLFTGSTWVTGTDDAGARYGSAVASAGDVNCDGFGDVVIGAPLYDGGQTSEGKLFVFYGTATGLPTAPSWTHERNQAGAELGSAVAGAGDMNGDDCGDLIAGAPKYDDGQTDEGAAFVFYGGAAGLASTPSLTLAPTNQASAQYGSSVAAAGHFNLDVFGDVVVGAPLYDNAQTNEGAVFVHYGSLSDVVTTLEANQAEARLGTSVAGSGDLDGDNYSDILAGAPLYDGPSTDEGRVFIYYGGFVPAETSLTLEGNQADARFGQSVAMLGDVGAPLGNVVGLCDLAIGAPRWDNAQTDEGRVFVWYGTTSRSFSVSADWTRESDQTGARLGTSVASAGDINGDGYADVIVGTPLYDNGATLDVGRAQLWGGSAAGLSGSAIWTGTGGQASAQLGASVASAGDVHGDGLSDVLVGSPLYDSGGLTDVGITILYRGMRASFSTSTSVNYAGGQANAQLGFAVAGAGDVDADGYADVVVGVPAYDSSGLTNNGRVLLYRGGPSGLATSASATRSGALNNELFGQAVAGAGDVNGDGRDDVLVGAPGYASGGQTDEGAAYLYLGTDTSIGSSHSWRYESNQVDARFGSTVAAGGDLNGDGRGDVLIAAILYDNGEANEGRVFVFHGQDTAAALPSSANQTLEPNIADSWFGYALAAGDVNRDGVADVIVGAPNVMSPSQLEGRVYLYNGVLNGTISQTPSWSEEADLAFAVFGSAVAAVDVDCNGYGDLVVGAPGYANGQSLEGAIYTFLGGSTGLSHTPTIEESNQGGSNFGASVANAGDVNGDGCGDVIVGAPAYDGTVTDEGLINVYTGSSSGLGTSPSSWIQLNQPGARFGSSVAGAGDINGDGMTEIIAGAPSYGGVFAAQGVAVVYMANSSDSGQNLVRGPLGRLLLARRPGATTRISPHGSSGSSSGYDVAMLRARGPMGRSRVQLQVESEALGTAFDGAGLSSTPWTDSTTSGEVVTRSVSGVSGGRYHYRARLQYDPSRLPWFQRSYWFYGGLPGEAHGVQVRTP